MKRALCALLCALLPLLCGCSDGLDLSLMIISMGVDVTENGVVATIKAPDYTGKSAAGQDDGGGQEYLTLSAAGVDWPHALAALNGSTPRALRFSQLREVVISLDSLQTVRLQDILSQVGQLQNIRSQAVLVLCRDDARTFLQQQQPQIGKRLSKYLDATLENYDQQGYIPSTTLAAVLRDLSGSWRAPLITYASLNVYDNLDAPQPGQPLDVEGGDLPRQGASTAEYVGGVAIGPNGDYTILTGYEVQLYHLIIGEPQSLFFAFGDRYYSAKWKKPHRLRIEEKDSRSVLTLELPVIIEYSMFSGEPEAGVTAFLEAEISGLMHKLQSVDCDALGFGSVAARRFATLYEWNAYGWHDRYREADIVVEVKAQMRQAGRL